MAAGQEAQYHIKQELTETPARDPNGEFTRVTLSVGTICKKVGRSEGGFDPGTIVTCKIGNNEYTNIKLYDDWANEGYYEVINQVGGRRRKAKKSKKSKKSKRTKRRHTRKH